MKMQKSGVPNRCFVVFRKNMPTKERTKEMQKPDKTELRIEKEEGRMSKLGGRMPAGIFCTRIARFSSPRSGGFFTPAPSGADFHTHACAFFIAAQRRLLRARPVSA